MHRPDAVYVGVLRVPLCKLRQQAAVQPCCNSWCADTVAVTSTRPLAFAVTGLLSQAWQEGFFLALLSLFEDHLA